MVFIVFLYIEIHRTVADISISVSKNLLNEFLLLHDMTCGMWLDRRRKHIQQLHRLMIAIGVILSNLHWLQLFKTCLLFDLIVTLVGIVLQVTYIGNIAYVAHLVAQVFQIAEHQVESDCWTCVSQVWIAIYSRSTNIHTHVWSMQRFE